MSSIVSSVTGQTGGNSGGAGLNYNAASANILNPTTVDQANTAYGQVQQGLTNQQQFLNAVQGQNGLQNQSSVYNQLQGVTNGTGPNPAQAQLAQATGSNTANQAALMAGQRGAGANVGLIARQAAQQGAANQQNAAGQAATLQATQSLNALGQQGQLATNEAGQLASATSANTNATQAEQSNLLNGIAAQNNANVGMVSNQNSANAGISAIAAGQQGQLFGGVTNGLGGVASMLAAGGPVQRYADGTDSVTPATGDATTGATSGAKSSLGRFLKGFNDTMQPQDPNVVPIQSGISDAIKGLGGLAIQGYNSAFGPTPTAQTPGEGGTAMGQSMKAAEGGRVPAMVSPGEKYLTPKDVKKVEAGADPLAVGKTVPGKPKVGGAKNDYANDTVKTTLEEGGIVLPRSVTQAKDPAGKAHAFVSALMAQKGKQLPKKSK